MTFNQVPILTASTRTLNLKTVRDCRFLFRVVSLPRNGSERNYESLLLFLFHGTEFRVVLSSAVGLGREFRKFASFVVPRNIIPSCFLFHGRARKGFREFSVPRNFRNSVGNNHLFHLFRLPRDYFLSEIPNPIRKFSNTELARLDNVYGMWLTLLFPVAILLYSVLWWFVFAPLVTLWPDGIGFEPSPSLREALFAHHFFKSIFL